MISVPNRPLLSSGNKLIFFLVLAILTSACDLFKKLEVDEDNREEEKETLDDLQGRKVYDPETGTYIYAPDNILTAKMDTIRWQDVPVNPEQIITTEGAIIDLEGERITVLRENEIGSQFLSAYNVSVVLPFMTHRFDPNSLEINRSSLTTLNFYGGVQMALDELDSEGIKLNVQTFDSQYSESVIYNLLRTNLEFGNSHLILGAFKTDNVRLIADYVKQTGQVYVSPYSAASSLSRSNQYYIQANPTLETHCKAITRHARRDYRPDQIVVIGRDRPNDRKVVEYFQEENFAILGERDEERQLQEYIIANDEDFEQIDVFPLLELQDTTVFIIPSWQEPFVYSLLRKIDLARRMGSAPGEVLEEYRHVVVYGMPQWANFELIDFEYYEKLNVHISSPTFIDPIQTDVKFFRSRFFDRFGTVPTDQAFIGYDLMLYMGRMLHKHGTKFQYSLDREMYRGLHTTFDFNKVTLYNSGSTFDTENLPIEQFENKYVNILRFQDYFFQLSN